MNKLVKGILLGGVSTFLGDAIYKKGLSDGYKKGKLAGKCLSELDILIEVLKNKESILSKETEN